MKKLNAAQLRDSDPDKEQVDAIERNPIYFVLDEILDTFNVGSMFRLADAVAAEKVYLCGNMEYPPNSRIHKAAVGTENWVPWVRCKSAPDAIEELKRKGVQTVAIEQDDKSISYTQLKPEFPIALILGHESTGVNEKALEIVDEIVELPMKGINISFNVWGSAAVVAYKLLESL